MKLNIEKKVGGTQRTSEEILRCIREVWMHHECEITKEYPCTVDIEIKTEGSVVSLEALLELKGELGAYDWNIRVY